MIKRALIVASFLLMIYSLVISQNRTFESKPQHQWQDNFVRAQRYLHNDSDTVHYVIAGTSLSSRLNIEHFPNTHNLAFGGQSLFDGLTLVKNSQIKPKVVLIETNFYDKEESHPFTTALTSPFVFNARAYIPVLQDQHQPVSYLGEMLSRYLGRKIWEIKWKAPIYISAAYRRLGISENNNDAKGEKSGIGLDKNKSKAFNEGIQLTLEKSSEIPDKQMLQERISALQEHVKYLQENKISVVFFEMPVDSRLKESPKAKELRKVLYSAFPRQEYNYIKLDLAHQYKTSDGVHLPSEEANKYSIYLINELRSIVVAN
jgi:hypothetical protein